MEAPPAMELDDLPRTERAHAGTGPLRLTAIHGAATFDTEWLTEPDPQWTSKPER
jgi:hypothetical protein